MSSDWASYSEGVLGAIFVVAGVTKVASNGSLRPFLAALGVPGRAARVLAFLVAPVEMSLGMLLLLGVAEVPVAAGAFALAFAFVSAQVIAARRQTATICRCFGILDVDNVQLALVRAIVVLLIAVAVLLVISSDEVADGADASVLGLGATSGIAVVLTFALLGQAITFNQHRPRFGRVGRRHVRRSAY